MKSKILFLLIPITVLFLACKDDGLTPNPGPKTDPNVTVKPFTAIPKLDDMVVYEVNMRAYSASGTFDGVTARMDHIESLGVNVIWLMPIFPIGNLKTINSPYSVKDFEAVSSEYGTLNDLIELVNEAHSRDIAVILDWVANHTAWDNAWIVNKDWYSQDANGDIIPPNFNGFIYSDVADLNFDNSAMQDEMIKAMQYWIKNAGIDGFRCDAADWVPESFWTSAITKVNSVTEKDLIWLSEGSRTTNFASGFEFDYSWDFYGTMLKIFSKGLKASEIFITSSAEFVKVPTNKTKLRYITNHDVYAHNETPNEAFGNNGNVGAFVTTVFMGGIPLIYNGQEVNHPNKIDFFNKNPINWEQNPEVLTQYQKIMEFRSGVTDILQGELIAYKDNDIIAYERSSTEGQVLILVNTRTSKQDLILATALQGTSWTNIMTDATVELTTALSLEANEYLILKK